MRATAEKFSSTTDECENTFLVSNSSSTVKAKKMREEKRVLSQKIFQLLTTLVLVFQAAQENLILHQMYLKLPTFMHQ